MIQISPYSLTSIWVALFVKLYFLMTGNSQKIKISLREYFCSNSFTTTYFIIKSKSFTQEKLQASIQEIRHRSAISSIIIIGSHIDYEELFRNHYQIFGVIDRTDDTSLKFLREQIFFYLKGIYPASNSNHLFS